MEADTASAGIAVSADMESEELAFGADSEDEAAEEGRSHLKGTPFKTRLIIYFECKTSRIPWPSSRPNSKPSNST